MVSTDGGSGGGRGGDVSEEISAAATTTKRRSVGGGDESASSSPRNRVKFMCSYGGKILLRPNDGQLKYTCGETRVVAVSRDINFSGLIHRNVNFEVMRGGAEQSTAVAALLGKVMVKGMWC